MLLNTSTEYSLRILLYLIEVSSRFNISAGKISEAVKLPKEYTAKILQKLAKGKFVVSQKGKGGGFRLIKSSNDISLGELIELFENQRFLSDCLIGLEKECKNCYCPIYSNWSLIKKEIYEVYLSDIHKRLTHNDN